VAADPAGPCEPASRNPDRHRRHRSRAASADTASCEVVEAAPFTTVSRAAATTTVRQHPAERSVGDVESKPRSKDRTGCRKCCGPVTAIAGLHQSEPWAFRPRPRRRRGATFVARQPGRRSQRHVGSTRHRVICHGARAADSGRSVARHRRSAAPRRLHPTSGHMPRRAPADFGRGVARHRRSRPSRSVTASSAVANSEVGDRRTQRT